MTELPCICLEHGYLMIGNAPVMCWKCGGNDAWWKKHGAGEDETPWHVNDNDMGDGVGE